MKKTLVVLVSLTISILGMAQSKTDSVKAAPKPTKSKTSSSKPAVVKPVVVAPPVVKKDWTKVDLSKRPADHLMLQFGSDIWTNRPDSVRTKGFSRHFNVYFMMDKPFKSNPKFSVAGGVGIGSSNIFFDNERVDLKSTGATLPFSKADSLDHFKKLKLTTIYAEIPVELRYFSDPEHPGKSWKAAIGLKLGTLLKAYTKGKNWVNKSGASYYGSSYVQKESNSKFINSTQVAFTGRIGYGIFSLDASYQATGVLKAGAGPSMNKISIGLTISGL